MSANWYTFKCYCNDEAVAKKLHQALLPLEEENYGSVVRRLSSFAGKSKLTEKDLDGLNLEYLKLHEAAVEFQLQGGTSSMMSKAFTSALANAGADLLVIDIYYDQVGESEEYYFKNGKPVEYDDIEDQLVALDPAYEIEQAIEDDDESKAIQLLKQGLDPNQLIDETPLLVQAIQYDMYDLALATLDAGASIPEDEDSLDELISSAIGSSHLVLITKLIEIGLDCTSSDESPFFEIDYKHKNAAAITRLLIENKVDVSITSEDGSLLWLMTPPSDITKILTAAGAQLIPAEDAYSGDYEADLHTAITHQHLDKLKQLWDPIKVKALNRARLIELCLEFDGAQILSALLGKSVDPFMTIEGEDADDNEITLIQRAVRYQSSSCFVLLLKHLPEQLNQQQQAIITNSYSQDCDKNSRPQIVLPLEKLLSRLPARTRALIAIQKDDVKTLKALAAQFKINEVTDGSDKPLLHQAIEWEAQQCLSYLLEQTMPLEQANANGNTALAVAISQGDSKITNLLLKAGSNPDILISPDPEDLAETAAEEQLAEMFFSAAAGSSTKGKKTMSGVVGAINALQDKYGPLEPVGKTPAIVSAAYQGDQTIVTQLLEAQAELDQVDAKGRTALMMAISDENDEIAETLLKAGADADIKSSDGKTAMQLAKSHDKSLVRLLKKYSKKKGIFKIF